MCLLQLIKVPDPSLVDSFVFHSLFFWYCGYCSYYLVSSGWGSAESTGAVENPGLLEFIQSMQAFLLQEFTTGMEYSLELCG